MSSLRDFKMFDKDLILLTFSISYSDLILNLIGFYYLLYLDDLDSQNMFRSHALHHHNSP